MADPIVEEVQPLCTLSLLKAVLGVSVEETLDDPKLQALIGKASTQIAAYCGRDFAVVEVEDELQDGDDSPLLTLARTPILAVTALSIDGQAVDVAEVKVYPNYIRFEDSGEYNPRLRSSNRIFPGGAQNIRSVTARATPGFPRISPRPASTRSSTFRTHSRSRG